MVKGITKELLYGTESTPALLDCITLYGEGKININTAPRYVLRALSSDITEGMTEEMDIYRRSEENDLSDPNWYNRVAGMANVTMPSMLITVKSNVFKIISSGTLDRMKESISGTIKRDQNNLSITILSWNTM
jgi:general secretion pathway protein K